ncbi:MAG: RAMP superfamily CRISPR-associated protein [Bryobacterales bacterium]|nr:RAMP superfamily CRISPR-associated protein [Bryobacteraceae bacterium]MDW8354574.1 RAMP superfamily CRISPR-associated protein [Bryobacterales bacterium]
MNESTGALDDAMEPRRITARWVIQGTLTLESATHLRGEPRGAVDMPVLRHPLDGRPLLPGTTLAGALRSALADRLAGYRTEPGEEAAQIAALFGGARGDEMGSQSPLVAFDSLGELPEGFQVEIRDGVAIDPEWGVAEAHKKFDFEVLPAGTRFPARVDLVLPSPDGYSEQELLALLAAALDAFSDGEVNLGARRARGLGKVSASWRAKRFDLTTPGGWMEWLLSEHENPVGEGSDFQGALEAIRAACPEGLTVGEYHSDRRQRIVIEVETTPEHDVLVRSPGRRAEGPDVSHLQSSGRPVLPGTSVAGALRAQALRIARLVRADHKDGDLWVERLFGPRPKEGGGEAKLVASRLRVAEVFLEGSHPAVQTRIALDRFTQEVVQGALFQEETQVGGRACLRLELLNPKEGELGLVLLVLKDLLHGRVAIGGSSAVGRGWVTGTAQVTLADRRVALLEPSKPPRGEAAEEVDRAIRAFHEAGRLVKDQEEGIRCA